MTLLPFLNPRVYDRVMIFLIALGIGAFSGSCVFVMIPQAFHLTAMEEVEYVSKSSLIITALYSLFTVDRLLQEGRQTTEETVLDEGIDRQLAAYPTTDRYRGEVPDMPSKASVSVEVPRQCPVDSKQLEVASVAYMIIFGSSANNFIDGMSLGTFAILINSGLGLRRTLLLNLLPTLLSFIGFSLGVLLDQVDESYDSYVFAVSSGMYLYIFLGTLILTIVNELIRRNQRESLVVTALHGAGIAGGVSFMFLMGRVGGAVLEEALKSFHIRYLDNVKGGKR